MSRPPAEPPTLPASTNPPCPPRSPTHCPPASLRPPLRAAAPCCTRRRWGRRAPVRAPRPTATAPLLPTRSTQRSSARRTSSFSERCSAHRQVPGPGTVCGGLGGRSSSPRSFRALLKHRFTHPHGAADVCEEASRRKRTAAYGMASFWDGVVKQAGWRTLPGGGPSSSALRGLPVASGSVFILTVLIRLKPMGGGLFLPLFISCSTSLCFGLHHHLQVAP